MEQHSVWYKQLVQSMQVDKYAVCYMKSFGDSQIIP